MTNYERSASFEPSLPALSKIEQSGPVHIGLIGSGAVARSLTANLNGLRQVQPFKLTNWSRSHTESLGALLRRHPDITHLWFAVSDGAIEELANQALAAISEQSAKRLVAVHFAGALGDIRLGNESHGQTLTVWGAHPLNSISGQTAISLSTPFITSPMAPPLSLLLPGFKNQTLRLDNSKRTLYHALCALSGNMTVILWETIEKEFKTQLGLPRETVAAYRDQIFKNLSERQPSQSVLTGPLKRGDFATVDRHLQALQESTTPNLASLYRAFVQVYECNVKSHPTRSEAPHV